MTRGKSGNKKKLKDLETTRRSYATRRLKTYSILDLELRLEILLFIYLIFLNYNHMYNIEHVKCMIRGRVIN